ncbi:MAG TPA: hypothetical protein VNZ48_17040, partial [Xanthobacteraceae bacterium]|nr:hypothetical protein [Xanthobacteraceae bacterium]
LTLFVRENPHFVRISLPRDRVTAVVLPAKKSRNSLRLTSTRIPKEAEFRFRGRNTRGKSRTNTRNKWRRR